MGLTISYRLRLPSATSQADVAERVEQLRSAAARLAFEKVGSLITLRAGQLLGDMDAHDPLELVFRLWATHASDQDDPETGGFSDILPDAVGFTVLPGAECEPAPFGVAWGPARDDDWNVLRALPWTWQFSSCCKTQYASIVSSEHFVRCHTSIVALLDEAVKLGFDVIVYDEGDYWDSRDADTLLTHVEHMNRALAALGGAIHDALGEDHKVEAPIFGHPDFERLEAKARHRPA